MEKLSGKQLDQMKFSGSEQVQSNSITATMAAQIHKIKNDQFGYIQNGLYDNWYQAIRAMTQSLLDDCARAKKKSKRGEKLLACIDRYQDVLKKAECCMVNFDIWWPNIICNRENGEIKYAWIDRSAAFGATGSRTLCASNIRNPWRRKKLPLRLIMPSRMNPSA